MTKPHLLAYKHLRDNGFKVSVGSSRISDRAISVHAYTDMKGLQDCGIIIRVEADTVQDGLIQAAKKADGKIAIMRECAEFVGEKDFGEWVAL